MSYENIKIEKGLYTTGKSFTQALEALDPSENYKGTSLEGLDAFERQLKRFDIKVSAKDCDTVSKFFQTTDSAALFPEFVSRSIKLGMKDNCTIDKIIATTTFVDSLDYRSIELTEDENYTTFNPIAEGTQLETVEIKVKDTLTKLNKYGKIISASYEAIKFQKLDVFSLALRRIGENIMRMEVDKVLEIANSNESTTIKYTGDTITYDGLVNLYASMSPFNLTTMLMSTNTYAQILKLPQFRDADAGLDFHGTGKILTPFGAEVIINTNIADGYIVALDKNYAIERVVASDITTEFDKLIDRQLERASISTIVGFNCIFPNAIRVFCKQV